MTKEDAERVAEVAFAADGGYCPYCAKTCLDVAKQFWPEWSGLWDEMFNKFFGHD